MKTNAKNYNGFKVKSYRYVPNISKDRRFKDEA